MRVPPPLALACCLLLVLVAAPAQRVVLPGATGGVVPEAGWTVLRQAQLEAASRPTDPVADAARRLLLTTIAELKQERLTDSHLLFHRPGADDALLLVQAYSDARSAVTADLLTESAVQRARDVLEPALAAGGAEVAFVGSERAGLFESGCARLTFTIVEDGVRRRHEHYIVPAGDHVQYFDCTSRDGDADGRARCEALIGTFDGAAEEVSRARGLWIGGFAGALAGIVAALARRKRQARAIVSSGTDGRPS